MTSNHSNPSTAAPIVFVDVETDGLHHMCRAWEVALLLRVPDAHGYYPAETVDYHWFLPIDLRHANPDSLRMGGFWQRHPKGRKVSGQAPRPGDEQPGILPTHDVARDIMRMTFGATLVGSNPAFDADVLARLLRAEGYLPQWNHRLRDVATLASGYRQRDVGGLDGALEALGLPQPAQRHSALHDARAARDVYDAIMPASQPAQERTA